MGTSEPWEDQPHNYDSNVKFALPWVDQLRIIRAEEKRWRKDEKRLKDGLNMGIVL